MTKSDLIERVASTFVERQGQDLAGGLVFRKFQPLKRIGVHVKSGAPLSNEIRSWVVRGGPLETHRYWGSEDMVKPHGMVTIADLEGVGQSRYTLMSWLAKSNFFTMDLAQLPDTLGGGWIIIELGDGQVAGLPEHVDAEAFYRELRARFL